MAAHAMRYPRRRRWPSRVLGLLATAAFLGSGVLIASWVMPQKDEPAASARHSGAAARKHAKAKPKLTKAQLKARKAAVAKLTADGYEAVSLRTWRPKSELKVLVGRNDAGAMRAFFFNGSTFVGYDDPATSNHVRVVRAGDAKVTLAYRVSTGGPEKVEFEWSDGTLQHALPVPPSSIR
jgi:hypothetical protein